MYFTYTYHTDQGYNKVHCKAVSDVQQFGYAYDTVQKYEEEHRGAIPDGQQDRCGTHLVFVSQLSSQDKE